MMSNKVFLVIIVFIVLGSAAVVAIKERDKPVVERPGTAHSDKGRQHVADGTKLYGGPEVPTSGDHGSQLAWQAYDQEIPDSNVIHNMEHGGIYVSYRPDLPAEQVAKLKALFLKPYSNLKFRPNKAILAPRAANDSPIILSSWLRSEKFSKYDEPGMIEYYLRNVGKSPEATAQ